MAARGSRVDVNDTPTLISPEGRYVLVRNAGAETVDLGGEDIASGTGYGLTAGEETSVDSTIDPLFGICAAGQTTIVEVLAVRRAYRD